MNTVLSIAAEEWRYWLRSHLALAVVALFIVILVSVSVLTGLRMQAESHERAHHQTESEQTFLSQPDRHPHRMVHYGHYIFRAPMPLALFDPGLDSVTGKAMFLEGHRQNSAAFSTSGSSADLGGLSSLTPALIYQLFAPLLIILLGHGALIREREAGTLAPLLAQGVSARALLAGKALALFLSVLLLLIPIAISVLISLGGGESLLAAASLVGVYFLYLSVWVVLSILASSLLHQRSSVIASLAACWLALTLVLPAVAVNVAAQVAPLAGKIESELTMLTEIQDLSDGHDVDDSAYDHLHASLLEEHGVDRVEDLKVNIRGILAQLSEKELSETLNIYAEKRMSEELRQATLVAAQGWFTPTLALAVASRTLSGTDLDHYHRFLREAEALRFAFVSGLNRVQTEQLSYVDDINRNRDEESFNRTRMDATNWQLLDEFHFEPASASMRVASAGSSIAMLLAWVAVLSGLLVWVGGRLKP
jgi:ABC-2 type transport system permease protein